MVNEKLLLDTIKKQSKWTYYDLARALRVPASQNREFSEQLRTLVNRRALFVSQKGDYYLPRVIATVEGELRLNTRGFGFIDFLPAGSDVKIAAFVAPSSVNGAFDGDTVTADIFADLDRPDAFQAVVKQVITRYKTEFVGRTYQEGGAWLVRPLDRRLSGVYTLVDAPSELEPDLEVKVQILRYGTARHVVSLMKVIGHSSDVAIDILAALEDANVPLVFTPAALAASATIGQEVTASDVVGRRDLRQDLIVTIDGDDTKDFDDAINVVALPDGKFMLGVHIADVSHYVKEDSPLDADAFARGTSIYLVDRVIPMLPEALSNGICSLNPHVDRLTLSAQIIFSATGEPETAEFFPSVINSKARLTYGEVNTFFSSGVLPGDPALGAMLTTALKLSHRIRAQKKAAGYIDFEIEESKIKLDERGKPVAIVPRERGESEMLIEDFMVAANEAVARHAAAAHLPFIYRVHAKPDATRITYLQGALKALGIPTMIPPAPSPLAFATVLTELKATRFDSFMKMLMLRTMAKAEYSPLNIGHFGLASRFYTHFTSPIRRYPDLLVHRMLRTYFFEQNLAAAGHFQARLGDAAVHTSQTEVRATELERAVADMKKAEYYQSFIGHDLAGTIVSIHSFGFFVEFDNKVNGLVHVSNLVDGKYVLSGNNFALSSAARTFKIGDPINVTVVGATPSDGRIDLVPTDLFAAWKARPPQPVPK